MKSALACDGASMTSFPDPARFARRSLAAALFATAMSTCASAADMPETILRGGTYSEPSPDYMRWDGVSLGATFGWLYITVDYSSAFAAGTTTKDQTNSAQFGGFLGYNWQWETLVLGVEGAYNRPASLDSSGTDAGQSATYKLIDYGTVRARAGYAYGPILPYAFLGFEVGLGVDVALMPNVFLRAEYEYVLFGPIGDIRSGISTARAGVGIRF